MEKTIFNIGIGKVTHWDLDGIQLSAPSMEQWTELKEDLAQIMYDNNCVDIGWHPEFKEYGQFLIQVIKDGDWDSPIIQLRFSNIELFVSAVNYAISIAISAGYPALSSEEPKP